MSAFRRVDGEQAGADALGILIPPGRRTVVVLRPRALDWDLLPVRRTSDGQPGTSFLEVGHAEAATVADQLGRALEAGRADGVAAALTGDGFLVRARVGDYPLLLCARLPGQPYEPLVFPTSEAAEAAAEEVSAVLQPTSERTQELYFNTRHFLR